MNRAFSQAVVGKALGSLLLAWVLLGLCSEFYQIAWGTGNWRGEFSRTWALLYYGLIFTCVVLFVFAGSFIWQRERFVRFIDRIIMVRRRFGNLRWLLGLFVLLAPIWFFQHSPWGLVFQKFYFRMAIWAVMVYLLAIIFSNGAYLAGWREFLASLVLTSSIFSIAASLNFVNGYPFSLAWSEGNRLWDYSILFGRELYDYPADQGIFVFLDSGRKLVGGLPFIFPGVTISIQRLWVGLTLIIPYLLLGLAAFRMMAKDKKIWLIATLWTYLFLNQGPIHAPLVLSAALVALAWRSPLWFAIPLVVGAGYFVQASRFTWVFAPGIWIVMLEFTSASLSDPKTARATWARSIALGFFGIFGGFFLPTVLALSTAASNAVAAIDPVTVTPIATVASQSAMPLAATPVPTAVIVENISRPAYIDHVIQLVMDQPLLWYRLLPNSTYGNGILYALLLAVGPLLVILFYLAIKKLWRLNALQKLCLVLPLLAFLAVGLVASTKIGGGGDLHNMDMFLIGLFFSGVVAWQNGGKDWLQDAQAVPQIMKIVVVVLLVTLSSVGPLMEMRSYSFAGDTRWLKTLTDLPEMATLDMLPVPKVVDSAIQTIQAEVDQAEPRGEILFIDQRQLLTFGYIKNVPLVPEYEKKVLMNQALSSDAEYFKEFYADLAAQRFSLIVSEPLRTPIKDSSYQFGEENNAWVKWVAAPILCYYEPLDTLKEVNVQLLIPKTEAVDCQAILP